MLARWYISIRVKIDDDEYCLEAGVVQDLVEEVLLGRVDATNGKVSDRSNALENLKIHAQDTDIPSLIMQVRILPDVLKTYNEKNPSVRICKVTTFDPYVTS